MMRPPRYSRPAPRVRPVPKPPAAPVAGKALGKVKHYFGRVRTAIIVCQQDGLMVGDTIRIKGHTTDLKLKVDSIMVHGKPLTAVEKGKDVAVRVTGKVRPDDRVYKVKE